MRRNSMIGTLIVVLSGLLAAPLSAQNQSARKPVGIYAIIDISSEITKEDHLSPPVRGMAFESYLNTLYNAMLANQAVSGLALQAHCDQLNPNPPGSPSPFQIYTWDYLRDAFNDVAAWNVANPNAPKNIQLIITPGFQSPLWVFTQIPTCDGLFSVDAPPAQSDCGWVTFTGFNEPSDGARLPLPWNAAYKSDWQTFLVALSNQFGSNPLLVSIAIGGPTAASDEMIMPNNNNCDNPQIFPDHVIPTPRGPIVITSPPISPNDMWLALFNFHYRSMGVAEPEYQNSDQAFIDEWDNAIDFYSGLFTDLTLVATTGSGFPDFEHTTTAPVKLPIDFTDDCGKINMDCDAETTILSHFVESTVGGSSNAKAVQSSGLEASSGSVKNLGIPGVRLVSGLTATFGSPSSSPANQILGGAQFNTSFSENAKKAMKEGSSKIPEQALYNVLQVFFTGTGVGSQYCEPDVDEPALTASAPLNYLQIYSQDFTYAGSTGAVPVDEGSCIVSPPPISAQTELDTAGQNLIMISD
jgi:hypothetical protein